MSENENVKRGLMRALSTLLFQETRENQLGLECLKYWERDYNIDGWRHTDFTAYGDSYFLYTKKIRDQWFIVLQVIAVDENNNIFEDREIAYIAVNPDRTCWEFDSIYYQLLSVLKNHI